MYCHKCGQKKIENSTFCSNCGNKLKIEPKEESYNLTDTKKDITIESNLIIKIILSIILPLFLLYIIENLGNFSYKGFPNGLESSRITEVEFTNIFGTVINDNLMVGNRVIEVPYIRNDEGVYKIDLPPKEKQDYILKAMKDDIYIPLSVSFILVILVIMTNNYKIKLE